MCKLKSSENVVEENNSIFINEIFPRLPLPTYVECVWNIGTYVRTYRQRERERERYYLSLMWVEREYLHVCVQERERDEGEIMTYSHA